VSEVLPYTGVELDRAGARRADADWVAAALADPKAVIIPVHGDDFLAAGGLPARLARADAGEVLAAGAAPVFLGLDPAAGTGVFAVDLSELVPEAAAGLAGAAGTVSVRAVYGQLSAADAALLGYARGITRWSREHKFCGACGCALSSRDGGHVRACGDCGRLHFPRIEPAVIVLVTSPPRAGEPDRCLLARHSASVTGGWATLAGFVEIGESLEEAVRRELAEEANVRVGEVRYFGSQPWPFPSGIMIGFRAVALSDRVDVDGAEVAEARWFTRADVRRDFWDASRRPDSIESYLIGAWLDEDPHG
jgi:NAD+ diphosphatase